MAKCSQAWGNQEEKGPGKTMLSAGKVQSQLPDTLTIKLLPRERNEEGMAPPLGFSV